MHLCNVHFADLIILRYGVNSPLCVHYLDFAQPPNASTLKDRHAAIPRAAESLLIPNLSNLFEFFDDVAEFIRLLFECDQLLSDQNPINGSAAHVSPWLLDKDLKSPSAKRQRLVRLNFYKRCPERLYNIGTPSCNKHCCTCSKSKWFCPKTAISFRCQCSLGYCCLENLNVLAELG